MLTKADFTEIRKIIREKVENEVGNAKKELQGGISMVRIRLQGELNDVKDRLKNVDIKTTSIDTRLEKVEKRVVKMHKNLKKEIEYVSHVLDKENMGTLKGVKRIEEYVGLTPQ